MPRFVNLANKMLVVTAVLIACGCDKRSGLTVSGPEFSIPGVGVRLPNSYHLWWRDLPGTGLAYWPLIWTEASPNENDGIVDHVVECDYAHRFIIAKVGSKSPDPVPVDPMQRYSEFEYWILDTEEQARFGPYGIEAFQEEREHLGVPETLRLRNVKELQKHAEPLPPR